MLDHDVQHGNPVDAPRLAPAIERVHRRTGRPPRIVTADRGYGEQNVDNALHDLGVRDVVIPRKGRRTRARQALEHRPAFRRTVKLANRMRRPDQHPQTRLRLGPHPNRHHRRSPDLGRPWRPHPQPNQDQQPGGMNDQQTTTITSSELPAPVRSPRQSRTARAFQVELANA